MRTLLTRGPLLLAVLLLPTLARGAEPGAAALTFLELLKKDERVPADLLKETALSPHCGKIRRGAIAQQLGDLGRYLRVNQFEFTVLDEKREGGYAGVLVSAVSRHDPLEVDVVAIGLCKVADRWIAAPVAGSFDNVFLGFDDELERRVDGLDLWMGEQRLKQLRALYSSVEKSFRERMATAVPAVLLEKANPVQVVEAFLQACLDGNLPAAMVLLGRFDEAPTEDDRRIQQIVSRGLQGLDGQKQWRLLTSPNVVRVVVQEDPGEHLDSEVVMLIFDPREADSPSLLRFVLERSGKRWEVELPPVLRFADEDPFRFRRALVGVDDADDEVIRKRFEEYFEGKHKARRAKTLEEAGSQIEKTLRDGSLGEFFTLLHRSDELSESERRAAYRYLGEFWSRMHKDSKAASDGEMVEIIGRGDAGVLVFHLISTSHLQRLNLVPLVLLREEEGWAIAPGVTTAGNYAEIPEKMRVNQKEAVAAFLEAKDELSKKAVSGFLERFVPAVPEEGAKVEAEEAGALVATFRSRLREGRLLDAFECCALLDSKDGIWEAMDSVRSEYRGFGLATKPDRQLGVSGGTHWAAVSLRVDTGSGPNSDPDYPMYLVVVTDQGPRIVVDAELRFATNGGRKILNKRAWERIEDQLEEKQTALVRTLFQAHVERSAPDYSEWEKSTKSSR